MAMTATATTTKTKKPTRKTTPGPHDPWSGLRDALRRDLPDDDERLRGLASVAGVATAHLPLYRVVISEHDRLSKLPTVDATEKASAEAGEKYDLAKRQRASGVAAETDYEVARLEFDRTTAAHSEAVYNESYLAALRGRWPELLGVEPATEFYPNGAWFPPVVANAAMAAAVELYEN